MLGYTQQQRRKLMKNNNQIDNTSYYTLPSGKQLEDFIHIKNLTFAAGSALKYLWRAGNKDGESMEKDLAKAEHYIQFMASHTDSSERAVRTLLGKLIKEAKEY
jgi:hypothetical protein